MPISAFAHQSCRHGFRQNIQVAQKTLAPDVTHIQLRLAGEIAFRAPADLRKAG
jgi:hypothetical protein